MRHCIQELSSAIDSLWFVADVNSIYKCPDRLRLPLVFYYAHTAVVYINKLMLAGLIKVRLLSVQLLILSTFSDCSVCFWKWFVSGLLPVCFRADLWRSQENSALCLQPLQCLQHTPCTGRGLSSFQLLESATLHYQVQCCNAPYNGLTGTRFYIIISK